MTVEFWFPNKLEWLAKWPNERMRAMARRVAFALDLERGYSAGLIYQFGWLPSLATVIAANAEASDALNEWLAATSSLTL